jgi:hypothetical protein
MAAANEVLTNVGGVLAALSALSTASFGLLDATKAFWGGVSNVGMGHLQAALAPFSPALDAAVGKDWRAVVRANWINGMSKPDQKSVVGALLKLGLSPETAPSLAVGGRVAPQALAAVAAKLEKGSALNDQDMNVLGRMTATVEALLDAAFERAEQQYRNVSRVLAGLVAVGVSVAAQIAWSTNAAAAAAAGDKIAEENVPGLGLAILVGLLAVPVAPVAKDLTSALSAAMKSIKAARTV